MTDSDQKIDKLINRIEELENTVEDQSDRINELEEDNSIINSRIDHINEFVYEVEEKVDDNVVSIDELKDIVMSSDKVYLTPAEELLTGADWSDIYINESKNRERAMDVLEVWDERSKAVGQHNQRLFIKDINNIIDKDDGATANRVAREITKLTENKIKTYKDDSNKINPDLDNYLLLEGNLISSQSDIEKIKKDN
jgi:uncharacterized coiled-coil protein SlyX